MSLSGAKTKHFIIENDRFFDKWGNPISRKALQQRGPAPSAQLVPTNENPETDEERFAAMNPNA
jgi:hypothetical protein